MAGEDLRREGGEDEGDEEDDVGRALEKGSLTLRDVHLLSISDGEDLRGGEDEGEEEDIC